MQQDTKDFDNFFGQSIRLSDISSFTVKTPLGWGILKWVTVLILIFSGVRLLVLVFLEDVFRPIAQELPAMLTDRTTAVALLGLGAALWVIAFGANSGDEARRRMVVRLQGTTLKSPILVGARKAQLLQDRLKALIAGTPQATLVKLPGASIELSARDVLALEKRRSAAFENFIFAAFACGFGLITAVAADNATHPQTLVQDDWYWLALWAIGGAFIAYLLLGILLGIFSAFLAKASTRWGIRLSNMGFIPIMAMAPHVEQERDAKIANGELNKAEDYAPGLYYRQLYPQTEILEPTVNTWFTVLM